MSNSLKQTQEKLIEAMEKEDYTTALGFALKAVELAEGEKQIWNKLNVVDVLMKLERFEEGRRYSVEAIKLFQELHGEDSYEYAYAFYYLGKVCFHLQKYETSLKSLLFFMQKADTYIHGLENPEEKKSLELLLQEAAVGATLCKEYLSV